MAMAQNLVLILVISKNLNYSVPAISKNLPYSVRAISMSIPYSILAIVCRTFSVAILKNLPFPILANSSEPFLLYTDHILENSLFYTGHLRGHF